VGTDIHIFIEYKVGDGPWFADKNHVMGKDGYVNEATANGRDYDLFGALAGVRNQCDYDARPKGLPNDLSELLKTQLHFINEFHSQSWHSLKDFKKIYRKLYSGKRAAKRLKDAVPEAFRDYSLTFDNLITYCEKQVKLLQFEAQAEKYLLNLDISDAVRCRLVYFFDS
jgi:hypothetical protein